MNLPSTAEKPNTFIRACSRAAITASIGVVLVCSSPSASSAPKDASTPPPSTAVAGPKFSNDSCERDADCAPAAMCHPDKCVARAHVGSMPEDVMCTMECRSGTVDCGYNHCGCVASPSGKKLCALLPGAPPKH
jgi:hypothetical protein